MRKRLFTEEVSELGIDEDFGRFGDAVFVGDPLLIAFPSMATEHTGDAGLILVFEPVFWKAEGVQQNVGRGDIMFALAKRHNDVGPHIRR